MSTKGFIRIMPFIQLSKPINFYPVKFFEKDSEANLAGVINQLTQSTVFEDVFFGRWIEKIALFSP